MTNEPQYNDMQPAPQDDGPQPEVYRRLQRETAEQPAVQRDVDSLLQEAATRPAPRALGDSIMDRIRKKEALPQPTKSGQALALGLGLMAALALPLLVALSLGVLIAFGTGSVLSGIALSIVGATMLLYALLMSIISGASEIVSTYPLLFALLLLVPAAWYGLWRMGHSWAGDA